MKTRKYLPKTACTYLVALSLAFTTTGCEDQYEVKRPSFNVDSSSITCKVGDKVNFDFTGTADIITFYSGERGNAYDHVGKERIYPAVINLSFKSRFYNTLETNANQPIDYVLDIFYSTDFDGKIITNDDYTTEYDPESVKAATWISIKDKFTWPERKHKTVPTESGEYDVTELVKDHQKPVYFGMKYIVKKYQAALLNRRVEAYIDNFKLASKSEVLPDPVTELDNNACGWKFAYITGFKDGVGNNFCKLSATRVTMTSQPISPTNDKQAWAITAPLSVEASTNLGPDWGTPIKQTIDPPIESYAHTYTTPGVYTVTFIAANTSVYGEKKVEKQLTITVTK